MALEKIIAVIALSAALLDGSLDAAMPDKNIDGSVFIINRQHSVSRRYVPSDLRKAETYGVSQQMRTEAATALEQIFEAAKEAGVPLSTVSGYRSYSKQATIYQRKVDSIGRKAADRISARPGTSEHQLGLAMDIAKKGASSLTTAFANTPQGQWVMENAHRYGFIIRYLKDYEDVTGYSYEPWHIRYVGTAHSLIMRDENLCLEEYIDKYAN